MPNPALLFTILVAVAVVTQPSLGSGYLSSHPAGVSVIQPDEPALRRLTEAYSSAIFFSETGTMADFTAPAGVGPHTDIPSLALRQIPAQTRFGQKKTQPSGEPVFRSEVVFALASTQANEAVVLAGRQARQGSQTYVSVDAHLAPLDAQERLESYNETWRYQTEINALQGGQYKANTRFALLPFLAYQDLGDTFKWMLLGEDSTVFFMDAILEYAGGLDHNMPYIVTDNLMFSAKYGGGWHPNPDAFRCAPCGYRPKEYFLPLRMPRGCPCTPELMCLRKVAYNGMLSPKTCALPRPPVLVYGVHGGGGMLISIGLLRSISLQSMETCLRNSWDYGGSTFLSKCLWEEGLGITDPDPMWVKEHGVTLFDPSPAGVNADEEIVMKTAHVLARLLRRAAHVCNEECELVAGRTMTLHLRIIQQLRSPWATAALMRALLRLSTDGLPAAPMEPPPGNLVVSRNATLLAEVLDAKVDALLVGYVEVVTALGASQQAGQGKLQESKVEAVLADMVLQLSRSAVEEILDLAVANQPYVLAPQRLRQPYRGRFSKRTPLPMNPGTG